jgi:alkylated DNA nucleotide flippase Atl1
LSGQVVGWILSGMTTEEWELIPWHRVVSKSGFISSLKLGYKGELQRQLLLEEGCNISGDQVDMTKHLVGLAYLQARYETITKSNTEP